MEVQMIVTIETDIITAGAEAFRKKMKLQDNPHPALTGANLAWLCGYVSEYYFSREGGRQEAGKLIRLN
jgi:hypothetical protein